MKVQRRKYSTKFRHHIKDRFFIDDGDYEINIYIRGNGSIACGCGKLQCKHKQAVLDFIASEADR